MVQSPRHDRAGAPLAAPLDARIFEGRAARIHRPGDALRYKWGEEHRDLAELGRIRDQIVGKKMVLGHPEASPENHYGMLEDGAEGRVVGEVIGARIDGDWVVARFAITDEEALRAIADGVVELSLGYRCRADADGYQRDTRVDHLAIVLRGRCGETCALRADDGAACGCPAIAVITHEVRESPAPVQDCACKTLAKVQDVGQSASHMPLGTDTQMDEIQKQLDAANAEIAALKARADEAEKALDSEKTRADEAEKALYNAKKDLESRADAEKKAIEAAVHAEKTRADSAELERDNAQKRADEAEASKAEAVASRDREWESRVDALVTDKVELLAIVAPLNLAFKDDAGEPVAIHKVDCKKIKLAAIQHVDAEDLSAKSDDWIECAFAGAMKRHVAATESRADAAAALAQVREEPTKTTPIAGYAAEKRYADQQRELLASAWKNPDQKDR